MRRRLGWAAVAVALAAVPALVLPEASGGVREASRGPLHPAAFYSPRAFSAALERLSATGVEPSRGARVVIVPHHWLAGHLILGGLRDLAAAGGVRRVILVGPNHIGAGGAAATTSGRGWATRFGVVGADRAAVSSLVRRGLARSEPDVLTWEHSISGIVPAIAREVPGARVVPLALRAARTPGEVRLLAAALAGMMDRGTVLVASVDFSHYLSAAQARERNRESVSALRAMDAARVLGWGNEHLDSPPSIALAIETARALGATEFVLRADSDSARLGGSSLADVTSYVAGYYR